MVPSHVKPSDYPENGFCISRKPMQGLLGFYRKATTLQIAGPLRHAPSNTFHFTPLASMKDNITAGCCGPHRSHPGIGFHGLCAQAAKSARLSTPCYAGIVQSLRSEPLPCRPWDWNMLATMQGPGHSEEPHRIVEAIWDVGNLIEPWLSCRLRMKRVGWSWASRLRRSKRTSTCKTTYDVD